MSEQTRYLKLLEGFHYCHWPLCTNLILALIAYYDTTVFQRALNKLFDSNMIGKKSYINDMQCSVLVLQTSSTPMYI